jgi:nicotinate dehydrogenase subunit A
VNRGRCGSTDTPLLHVLRNQLGLKGSRFGCGIGLCGACVVLVEARRAFLRHAVVGGGKSIVTVEGLASEARCTRVQQALLDNQCAMRLLRLGHPDERGSPAC